MSVDVAAVVVKPKLHQSNTTKLWQEELSVDVANFLLELDAVLWTTATHSRFCAATTATTSGDEATTSSGARWTSYSHG